MNYILASVAARIAVAAAASSHTFKSLAFDLDAVNAARTLNAAKQQIYKALHSGGTDAKILKVKKDPNGGWCADVVVPETDLKKFALHYCGGDKDAAADFLEDISAGK